MDQLWHEPRSSWRALIPNRVVNVKHWGAPRIGVDDIVFRDETFSGNEIGNAVSIHVGISGAMEFGECDTAGIFGREVIHNQLRRIVGGVPGFPVEAAASLHLDCAKPQRERAARIV